MDWQTLFIISGGTIIWWRVLKHLFGDKMQALYDKHHPQYPEWTEVDVFYHSKFIEHVDHCKECDPQDEPCEIGNQMLEDWKTAKEIE